MFLIEMLNGRSGKRDIVYAICGGVLGIMAPLGWIVLRLLLFWDSDSTLLDQVVKDIIGTEQSLYLYIYMCGGTMMDSPHTAVTSG